MDIFCEYMVKRNKGAKEIAKIIVLIVAAIILSFLFTIFLGIYSFIFLCGIWYGAWYLITATNVEYEYIVTSTALDIDKITAKRSRKRLLNIDLKEIASCKPIEDMPKSENIKIMDVTPNGEEDGVYGIDFEKNGTKTRLLFKPGKKMLTEIKKASPSLVTLRLEDIER